MSASKERHKYAPIHQAETKDEDVDLKQFDIEKPADGHSNDVASVQTMEVDQENMTASTKKQGLNMEKWKRFILAWVSIILAILAGASIGPAFKYMSRHGIRSCLSASWRCQCMLIFLLPIAVLEVVADKNKRVDWFARKPDLKYPVIVHVFFSGLAWAGNLLTWIVGLQYTTTFKASLIACSHPLMLALFLLFRGDKVSWLGLFGILVSFSGLIISNLPDLFNDSGRAEDGSKLTWAEQALGIFLCLLAAACEVVVLFNRIVTQKYVPLMQYTFATTIVVALGATLASIFLEGTGIIHSAAVTDEYGRPIPQTIEIFCLQDNCIFGWMAKKWAVKILMFGLLVGVVCIAGFNYAMQYLPPLVFSSTSLLDPALTAIISWIAGVEALPSLYSWFGGFIVMLGVAVISIGEHPHDDDEAHTPKPLSDSDNSIDISMHDSHTFGSKNINDDDGEIELQLTSSSLLASQAHESISSLKTVTSKFNPPAKNLFSVVSEDDYDNDEEATVVLHSSERPISSTHYTAVQHNHQLASSLVSSLSTSSSLSSLQDRYRRLQEMDDKKDDSDSLSPLSARSDGFFEERPFSGDKTLASI